jgi:hypothetical protein
MTPSPMQHAGAATIGRPFPPVFVIEAHYSAPRLKVMLSPSFSWARFFAWLGAISIVVFFIGMDFSTAPRSPGPGAVDAIAPIAALISGLTLIVATFGTASTILLGWRADKRQNAEFKLKIEQLQLELAEAREKASKAPQN